MVNSIPVLYVHSKSNYKKFPFFDCYDEKRDNKFSNVGVTDTPTPVKKNFNFQY